MRVLGDIGAKSYARVFFSNNLSSILHLKNTTESDLGVALENMYAFSFECSRRRDPHGSSRVSGGHVSPCRWRLKKTHHTLVLASQFGILRVTVFCLPQDDTPEIEYCKFLT